MAGLGLEALAEDGDPVRSGRASLTGGAGVASVAVFNTPVGAMAPAPIFPGESYQITFTAKPGDRLSLATMFVQSNDLFYAFDAAGLDLFDAMGNAVLGDVTGQCDPLGCRHRDEPVAGSGSRPGAAAGGRRHGGQRCR